MRNQDVDLYLLSEGSLCFQGIDSCLQFLRDHPVKSAVIFCNFHYQSQHFWDHLESKLNQLKLNVGVLHINGLLHQTDKFWRIRLFGDEGHIRKADFRVLVTTNAANVGIDKSQIAPQVQFDWPRDILTCFQECGCRLHQPGVRSTCVLYADLSSYVFLLCQLIHGSEHTNITVESQLGECEGFNSAISPQRPPARPANTSHKDFALGPTAKKCLQDHCIKELHKVVHFFCVTWDVSTKAARSICPAVHSIQSHPQCGAVRV